MAKFNLTQRRLSDLIVHEADSPFVGYTRTDGTDAVVTVAGTDVLTLGTPVFRAKGAVAGAKWAPVKAAANVAATNEYALVIADGLGEQNDVSGAGNHKVTLLVRGNVVVKKATVEAAAKAVGLTVAADQANLVHLLKAQGIVAETTIAA